MLIGLYLGYGGLVLVAGTWLVLSGEYEPTFRFVGGLVFFAIVVLAVLFILGHWQ
jgi:hypothetical protein